jgi:hypothetical protein
MWTRRAVLTSSLLAAFGARGAPPLARRRMVLIFADGGWDVSYVFDPKPGLGTVEGPEVDADPDDPEDVEALRSFGDLRVQVNDRRRPAATAFFERWASRTAVVNGIFVGSIGHHLARVRMLTGVASSHPGPDLAQIVGATHAASLPVGCVDLSGFSSAGHLAPTSVQVGARGQLANLLDPASEIPRPASSPPRVWTPSQSDLAALDAYQRARSAQLRAAGRAAARLDDLDAALDRATALRARADALTGLLAPGQDPTLATQVDLAVELLRTGTCHTVFVDTAEDWDTHTDTVSQHAKLDLTFRELDRLVAGLDGAGLLDDTLVVVVSEMTRTPVRNPNGGKDHWPHTSALLVGGGTAGGQVLGQTDDWLQALPVDLETGRPDDRGERLTYASFAAGLLERLDVDPERWLPGTRPWRGAR